MTQHNTDTTTRFEVGTTYATTRIGDHRMIVSGEVVARTPKFVTFRNQFGETNRVKVTEANGVETAFPSGKHANAPMLKATRTLDDVRARLNGRAA